MSRKQLNLVGLGVLRMDKKAVFYKVISWRLVSIVSMLVTLWILTGDIGKSTGVTLIVQLVQTMVHGVFETLWERRSERRRYR